MKYNKFKGVFFLLFLGISAAKGGTPTMTELQHHTVTAEFYANQNPLTISVSGMPITVADFKVGAIVGTVNVTSVASSDYLAMRMEGAESVKFDGIEQVYCLKSPIQDNNCVNVTLRSHGATWTKDVIDLSSGSGDSSDYWFVSDKAGNSVSADIVVASDQPSIIDAGFYELNVSAGVYTA